MVDVYRYGRLNLAATAASSGADCMSYTRDGILASHLRVRLAWNRKTPGIGEHVPAPGLYYVV
jgi:hypothetical protein